ncbi:PfkB family carbohydrate kinase [Leifsonia shinshuensis]|uniref:carbohydrate kinase family protein n=1 Tax=Leifsonia shinshuensis TaxID=150026 RepID=UPI0028665355|nr:PfkB family carbohydrate kinase [Leifsonia shinshuensis]MDR6971631.1 sugar/nucleoside kinase (ribokinase family) [Leifsonia shinshuensis]
MHHRLSPPGVLLFTGDVFCDLIFAGADVPVLGQETYADRFGIVAGGAAIRAVAAARLGADSRLVSTMGDDVIGSHIRTTLRSEANLDLDELVTISGYQTPISVAISGPHDRGFITYVEEHPAAIPQRRDDVAAVHLDVADAAQPWATELRSRGAVMVGGVGWDASGEWSTDLLAELDKVDVFVPNHDEAMAYTRTSDPVAAARALAEHVGLAVVTRGAGGVLAVDSANGDEAEVPGIPVAAVDPTGAGDVFTAALMTSFGEDWTLSERLRFATAAAAYSVTGLGGSASAPTAHELVGFVERRAADSDWGFLHDWTRRAPLQQTTATER